MKMFIIGSVDMGLSLIVMEIIFQDTIILNSELIEDTLRMIFDNFHI